MSGPALELAVLSSAAAAPRLQHTAAPAAAPAVGFGPPELFGAADRSADSLRVAITPGGETAVLWLAFDPNADDRHFVVATGPSPEELGDPRVVAAGERAARSAGQADLFARPEGGFVACFSEDRRRGQVRAGCTFSEPGGSFGPLRTYARGPWQERPTAQYVMRADGTLVLVLGRPSADGRGRTLRTTTLDASGRLGRPRMLATVSRESGVSLAALDDGTVAVGYGIGGDSYLGNRTPVLRLMPPGSDAFGPDVRFSTATQIGGGPDLIGGPSLLVRFTTGDDGDDQPVRYVRRRTDGSFEPPLTLPRPGPGFIGGSVLQPPDGRLLAISTAEVQSETDCGNVTGGTVGVGPIVISGDPVTARRLSAPGQIAQYAQGAMLTDGTVIAVWGDAAGSSGTVRLEAAVRAPGATGFAAAQVLPHLAPRDVALAGGGDEAVLAWVVGDPLLGPSRVAVSALRREAPFAAPAARPKRSTAPCN